MEYIIKLRTSKDRKLHTSKNAQDAVKRYLQLALACDVDIVFARELPKQTKK